MLLRTTEFQMGAVSVKFQQRSVVIAPPRKQDPVINTGTDGSKCFLANENSMKFDSNVCK